MYAEGDSKAPDHSCARYLQSLVKEVCAKLVCAKTGDLQMVLVIHCFKEEIDRFKQTKKLTKHIKEDGNNLESEPEEFDGEFQLPRSLDDIVPE